MHLPDLPRSTFSLPCAKILAHCPQEAVLTAPADPGRISRETKVLKPFNHTSQQAVAKFFAQKAPLRIQKQKKHCNRSWVKLIKHYLNILSLRGELL